MHKKFNPLLWISYLAVCIKYQLFKYISKEKIYSEK